MTDGDDLAVLEANAIPGLTDTSLLPLAADAAGIAARVRDELAEVRVKLSASYDRINEQIIERAS